MSKIKDTKTNQIVNKSKGAIVKVLARLTATGLISFGIGGAVTFDRYNNYWNQTIFRVQTVDFNILSHTLPTKISYALIKKQPEEVQRTLDSNYSLFGLVVTDSSGQNIIAYSGKNSGKSSSWKAALDPKQLQNHPYDVLLDPPPLFPQWNYDHAYATERSATRFTNQGRVIGRVYYVRGVRPTFQDDLMTLISNPFSGSSRIQTYTTSLVACFGATLLIWSGLEFMLYKKRVGEEKAQRETELAQAIAEKAQGERELAEERAEKAQRELELAQVREDIAQQELELAREREEKAHKERELAQTKAELAQQERKLAETKAEKAELAQQKTQKELELIEERNQNLINDNQILQVQLAERVSELQLLQKQRDNERNEFEKEANNLRITNKKLASKIDKLTNLINNLSSNANSIQLQKELKEAQAQSQENLQQKQKYENHIKQLTQKLQVIHNKQLQAIQQNEQKDNELQELQQQINEIEDARNLAKSQLEELHRNEKNYQELVERLEQQINQQNFRERELQTQLESLQNSLTEYQQREQLLEQRAKQAKDESDRLAEEIARAKEDMGQHPLNNFEVAIKECLEQNFSNARIETQFDVGTGRQGSRFTDFILVTQKCCILLEAKSYTGKIKPIDNVRNSGWICERGSQQIHIFSCWGKNPYQQVKAYYDSLKKNNSLGISNRLPIYGIVVFPRGSYIDDSIQSNISDKFYRITTLDNLTTTIQELENHANSWN
jgi:hypothetical protein